VDNLVNSAVKSFGRLDVLVNNAGIFTGLHTIVDETEDEYDRTMAVNAKSVWLGCKFAIRQMLTQEPVEGSRGRIVNIASIGGLVGLAAEPGYCAAKGAVVNLTRQLAVDFASCSAR
jgi:NAD(P)-dependent dehydrogenase (short-subunit alcohol dehydrogenase family)